MVPIAHKAPTARTARAACRVVFSSRAAPDLLASSADGRSTAKGDVFAAARIAGIMAAKRTADLVPLCHPLMLSHVGVEVTLGGGDGGGAGAGDGSGGDGGGGDGGSTAGEDYWVDISTTVSCDGKTGVEMEALTAASVAALTVYDMCKAVDKGMRVEGLRVVLKEGGKSGRWVEGTQDGGQ